MIKNNPNITDYQFDENLGVLIKQADALIINYNKQALIELHSNNLDQSHSMFMKAYDLLKSASATSLILLKSMTLNNLASLCLKKNDLKSALSHLSEAEKSSIGGSKTNLAITYINLSSILTYSSLPEAALDPLLKACKLLKEAPSLSKNVLTSLVISLHNLGHLNSILGNRAECESSMRESWELSLQHFGADHSLTQTVFKNLNDLSHQSYTHIKLLKNAEIEKNIRKEEKKIKKLLGGKQRHMSNGASDFKGIRFLTGERLQPMHKTKAYGKIRTRPGSRTTKSASKVIKQKVLESMMAENSELNGFAMIEAQIEGLQEKIDSFQEKCLPLKALAEDSEECLSSGVSVNELRKARIEEIRNKAASDIQRAVRRWKGRNERKRIAERQKRAAKEILAVFRGFLGKNEVRRRWEELAQVTEEAEITSEEAAKKIQTAFRGLVERRKYWKMRRCAVRIQALVRMWLVRIIYKDVVKAVVVIQRAYRRYKKDVGNKVNVAD